MEEEEEEREEEEELEEEQMEEKMGKEEKEEEGRKRGGGFGEKGEGSELEYRKIEGDLQFYWFALAFFWDTKKP